MALEQFLREQSPLGDEIVTSPGRFTDKFRKKPMRVEKLTARVLVNTNVLIYATLASDLRHEQARPVLAQRLRLEVKLFISVQNLAEMYPNLASPKNKPPDSPKLAHKKIQSLARLRGFN